MPSSVSLATGADSALTNLLTLLTALAGASADGGDVCTAQTPMSANSAPRSQGTRRPVELAPRSGYRRGSLSTESSRYTSDAIGPLVRVRAYAKIGEIGPAGISSSRRRFRGVDDRLRGARRFSTKAMRCGIRS